MNLARATFDFFVRRPWPRVAFAVGAVLLLADRAGAQPLTVSTLAGVQYAYGSTNGTGSAARFGYLFQLTLDRSGNILVADDRSTIRKVTPSGVVTTYAGTPGGGTGSADGTAATARFNEPVGVAIDSLGNVYVADTENHTIRKISTAGSVTTVAGKAGLPGYVEGNAGNARFQYPQNLAIDRDDVLYVTDQNGQVIRKVTVGGDVSTFAGKIYTAAAPADGTGANAVFQGLMALCADAAGNLFVGDVRTVRKVTPAGVVSTIAGSATQQGGTDGLGPAARFNAIWGVAVDQAGNVLVADGSGATIRLVSPSAEVTTIAGSYFEQTPPNSSGDGVGSIARFSTPHGIAVDATGVVYIADGSTIRRGAASGAVAPTITSHPQTIALPVFAGQTVKFEVVAAGTPAPSFQWQKNGTNLSDGGSIAGARTSVLTLANVQITDSGSYAAVVSNSAGSKTSNAATLTVSSSSSGSAAPTISTQPLNQTVAAGGSLTLSVTATGSPAPSFQWQKNGTVIVGATGASFTIPVVQSGDAGNYAVIVANASGTVTSNPAVLTVTTPSLTITTAVQSGSVATGGNRTLSVTATGTGLAYQWQLNGVNLAGATGATLPLTNVGTTQSGTYTVVVTNSAGASATSSATVTVTSTARPINISSRALVLTGTSNLVSGFVITGTTSETVLIRAVGPGLGALGLDGVLSDPQLKVFDASGTLVATSTAWGGSAALSAAFTRVGAFALAPASKDAAVLLTLAPGAYTAQVGGAGGDTGIALLEVYDVP